MPASLAQLFTCASLHNLLLQLLRHYAGCESHLSNIINLQPTWSVAGTTSAAMFGCSADNASQAWLAVVAAHKLQG